MRFDWFLSGRYRALSIAICMVVFLAFALNAPSARLDASSESLMLKNSESLEYYDEVKERYGSDNFLIITFTPDKDLFDPDSLINLASFKNHVEKLPDIKEVTSILDVPLVFKNQLDNFAKNKTVTLEDNIIDVTRAKMLLSSNPLYKDLLINVDANTTGLVVDLSYADRDAETRAISAIRETIEEENFGAKIHMVGVPMIVHDSISFIESDISSFGMIVLGLIILILFFVFRSVKWILLTVSTCAISILTLVGLLGFLDWPITVVSSNFAALMLIMTLSITIHYIIKHRETSRLFPKKSKEEICKISAQKIFKPCLYTALTTMVAFSSLVFSNIKPVMDFGWMMTIGIGFGFLYNFFFLIPLSTYLKFESQKPNNIISLVTKFFASITLTAPKIIALMFIIIAGISAFGVSKLSVENRFIDYFKTDTDIHQGMVFLDKNLGGTMPLDIIIAAPQEVEEEYYDEDMDYVEYDKPGYWSSIYIHDLIYEIHKIIESQPETGKVLSYSTTLSILKDIDDGSELDSFTLGVIKKKVPDDINSILFKPYISEDSDELRFTTRIYETNKDLKRQELVDNLVNEIAEKTEIEKEQIKVTGMLIFYNEMLSSLFNSQIKTISYVFIVIFLMFLVAFKSLFLAGIGIVANMFSCLSVLGIMGLFSIPLDIMTIGIASISIGIAIDDTIHYMHRYREQTESGQNYKEAVKTSHTTIGRAMLLTTLVIMIGFAVLAFSNFVPTVYFGLLTGFAMLVGLIANMTLLPVLLKRINTNNHHN